MESPLRVYVLTDDPRHVQLRVSVVDQAGILFRLSEMLTKNKIEISSARTTAPEGDLRNMLFQLRVPIGGVQVTSSWCRKLEGFVTQCETVSPPKPADDRILEKFSVNPDLLSVSSFCPVLGPAASGNELLYKLQIEGVNQPGLLAYVSLAFFRSGFSIEEFEVTSPGNAVVGMFLLGTKDIEAEQKLRMYLDLPYDHLSADEEAVRSPSTLLKAHLELASPLLPLPGALGANARSSPPRALKYQEIRFPNGDTYKGESAQFPEGERLHGHGEYGYNQSSHKSYRQYTGQWSEGRKHGRGVLLYQAGGVYVGDWAQNERHGRGVLLDYDAAGAQPSLMPPVFYEGDWFHDKKHGYGVEETATTSFFGHFHEDEPSSAGGVLVQLALDRSVVGCEVIRGKSSFPLLEMLQNEVERLRNEVMSQVGESNRVETSRGDAEAASVGVLAIPRSKRDRSDARSPVASPIASFSPHPTGFLNPSPRSSSSSFHLTNVDETACDSSLKLLPSDSWQSSPRRRDGVDRKSALASWMASPAQNASERSLSAASPRRALNHDDVARMSSMGPIGTRPLTITSRADAAFPYGCQGFVEFQLKEDTGALLSPCVLDQPGKCILAESSMNDGTLPRAESFSSVRRRTVLSPMLWSEEELAAFVSCLGFGDAAAQLLRRRPLRSADQLLQMEDAELISLLGDGVDPSACSVLRRALKRFLELDRWKHSLQGQRYVEMSDDPVLSEFAIPLGDLEVKDEICQGGFGTVYRGVLRANARRGRSNATPVAVKDMKGDQNVRLHELLKEGRIMASLHHPNICRFVGVCAGAAARSKGKQYVLSELMDCSLFDLIHEPYKTNWSGTWTTLLAVDLFVQILTGIEYLHLRKLVHADLKSPNVLVKIGPMQRLVAKICDFGHVAVRAHPAPHRQCGTPHWAAPEALRNEAVAPAADIFSCGVMLWEALTQSVPHRELTFAQVVGAVGWFGWVPDASLLPQLPEELLGLLRECQSFLPSHRPTATQVRKRLRRLAREARNGACLLLSAFLDCIPD